MVTCLKLRRSTTHMLRHMVEGWISKRCNIRFEKLSNLLYSPVGNFPYVSLLYNSTTDSDLTYMKRMFIWLIIALSIDTHPKCCHVPTLTNNASLYEFLCTRILAANCRNPSYHYIHIFVVIFDSWVNVYGTQLRVSKSSLDLAPFAFSFTNIT
jgi:hypothetical protein